MCAKPSNTLAGEGDGLGSVSEEGEATGLTEGPEESGKTDGCLARFGRSRVWVGMGSVPFEVDKRPTNGSTHGPICHSMVQWINLTSTNWAKK
jgi:hypothetical protein